MHALVGKEIPPCSASRSLGLFGWCKSQVHAPKWSCSTGKNISNAGKTILNHPMFDGLYHPFMVFLDVFVCGCTWWHRRGEAIFFCFPDPGQASTVASFSEMLSGDESQNSSPWGLENTAVGCVMWIGSVHLVFHFLLWTTLIIYILYSVHYHVWFDVWVLTFMLPMYAMWILNVHMPYMHRCVEDTVSHDVVRCSLFHGTFFRVPSCWYFSWPHLWREDFIAAICCRMGHFHLPVHMLMDVDGILTWIL